MQETFSLLFTKLRRRNNNNKVQNSCSSKIPCFCGAYEAMPWLKSGCCDSDPVVNDNTYNHSSTENSVPTSFTCTSVLVNKVVTMTIPFCRLGSANNAFVWEIRHLGSTPLPTPKCTAWRTFQTLYPLHSTLLKSCQEAVDSSRHQSHCMMTKSKTFAV